MKSIAEQKATVDKLGALDAAVAQYRKSLATMEKLLKELKDSVVP